MKRVVRGRKMRRITLTGQVVHLYWAHCRLLALMVAFVKKEGKGKNCSSLIRWGADFHAVIRHRKFCNATETSVVILKIGSIYRLFTFF